MEHKLTGQYNDQTMILALLVLFQEIQVYKDKKIYGLLNCLACPLSLLCYECINMT